MLSAEWADTLSRVTPAIVALRVLHVRSHEGQTAQYSYATGFVVDAVRGLILTNRHVTTTGPITAEAILSSREEVAVTVAWVDPLHDFAFLRYEPGAVKHTRLVHIPLAPEAAVPGLEFRVVGNDAGEKLSVLAGSLSRLDRAAPDYGTSGQGEWNIFYVAAAAGTSGGSSGSPVLNREGQAVALNAGGKRSSASSFFLPLDRAVRVLRCLQMALPVPRGELLVVFNHEPYDAAARLGLTPDAQAHLRATFPTDSGVLTVENVLKGGPADPGRGGPSAAPLPGLEVGDLLLAVNGVACTHFTALEEAVDSTIAVRMAYAGVGTALGLRTGQGLVEAATNTRVAPPAPAPTRSPPFQQTVSREKGLLHIPLRDSGVLPAGVTPSTPPAPHHPHATFEAGLSSGTPSSPLAFSADMPGRGRIASISLGGVVREVASPGGARLDRSALLEAGSWERELPPPVKLRPAPSFFVRPTPAPATSPPRPRAASRLDLEASDLALLPVARPRAASRLDLEASGLALLPHPPPSDLAPSLARHLHVLSPSELADPLAYEDDREATMSLHPRPEGDVPRRHPPTGHLTTLPPEAAAGVHAPTPESDAASPHLLSPLVPDFPMPTPPALGRTASQHALFEAESAGSAAEPPQEGRPPIPMPELPAEPAPAPISPVDNLQPLPPSHATAFLSSSALDGADALGRWAAQVGARLPTPGPARTSMFAISTAFGAPVPNAALSPGLLRLLAVGEHACTFARANPGGAAVSPSSSRPLAHSHTLTLPIIARAELGSAIEAVHGAIQAYGQALVACCGEEGEDSVEAWLAARTGPQSIAATAGGASAVLDVTDTVVAAGAEEGPFVALHSARTALETALAAVDGACTLSCTLIRGGAVITREIAPLDATSLVPTAFVEVSGAVLHPVSLHCARAFGVKCGPAADGVFVSLAGFMLSRADVAAPAILTALGDTRTPTLEAFMGALGRAADGARLPLRYRSVAEESSREHVAVVTIDRKWTEAILWRAAAKGTWVAMPLPPPPLPVPPRPATLTYPSLPGASPAAHALFRSLVVIEAALPIITDGVHSSSYVGCGLVVAHDSSSGRGLLVTDRNTVPVSVGDFTLTFASSHEVPARLVFLHPVHNIAVLSYDAALLGNTPVHAATLDAETGLGVGDGVSFIGLTVTGGGLVQTCTVTKVQHLSTSDGSPPFFRESNAEAVHFDRVVSCLGGIFTRSLTGPGPPLVCALWASYAAPDGEKVQEYNLGLPADMLADVVLPLLAGSTPRLASIQTELKTLPLAKARMGLGLSDEWAARLSAASGGDKRQVLCVRRATAGSAAASLLREGDLLLAVDGVPVTSFRGAEVAIQYPGSTMGREGEANGSTTFERRRAMQLSVSSLAFSAWSGSAEEHVTPGRGGVASPCSAGGLSSPPSDLAAHWEVEEGVAYAAQEGGPVPLGSPGGLETPPLVPFPPSPSSAPPPPSVTLTLLRDGAELNVPLTPIWLDGRGTGRFVTFAGLLLQDAHPSVLERGFAPAEGGVYCSRWSFGSPAHAAGMRATHWITSLGEQATPTLDHLLSAAEGAGGRAGAVRVRTVDLVGRARVFALRLDLLWWPTYELSRGGAGGGWALVRRSPKQAGSKR
jgi:S1-C subfamily serine protease